MEIGSARTDITPVPGLALAGQMHERIAASVHDPLLLSAIAFRDGHDAAVVVSCDLCVLTIETVRKMQATCAERCGVPAERILIHCTHTHVAPATTEIFGVQADPDFMFGLANKMTKVVAEAVADLGPVEIYAGSGTMNHMGWNRRGKLRDGTSAMYAGAWVEGFAGPEGPRDPQVIVLTARRPDGAIKAMMLNFSTHPNTLEGGDFYSADIPGEVRRVLWRIFGEEMDVVYLTGAAGNTAPTILEKHNAKDQPWRGEEGLKRSGLYLGCQAARIAAASIEPTPGPALRFFRTDLPIDIRLWHECIGIGAKKPNVQEIYAAFKAGWDERCAKLSPVPVAVNVLRIGNVALCTNAGELFVEHGLAIKKDSPARLTMVSELTDGYVGYVPTRLAFERGGYETWPAPTSQLSQDAGDSIVAETIELLKQAFAG